MQKKTIDIILFCYKQEQYIEQALRSIFTQELPKDVTARIIVADDCSPDNTLDIIKRLASESPFPMEFLPEEPNMGISKNYKRSFAATKAEYVAILEGDDYWLPNHLIYHVEFLQNHPECSMSMNEYTCLYEQTNETRLDQRVREADDYVTVDIHEQIKYGNCLGNLSACVFRGNYLRDLPADLFEIPIADWMVGVMFAERGDIAILKGTTSVYRIKPSGVWSGTSKWTQHVKMINIAKVYNNYTHKKYDADWKAFIWYERRKYLHYLIHFIPKRIKRFICR